MIWAIVEHYLFGVTAVGIGVGLWVVSVLLQAEVESIPLIGPWLGRNIQHIREAAVVIAVLGLSHTLVYGIGVSNGKAEVKAQWAAAEKAAVDRAKSARASAVDSVKRNPGGVRNDIYDRDN